MYPNGSDGGTSIPLEFWRSFAIGRVGGERKKARATGSRPTTTSTDGGRTQLRGVGDTAPAAVYSEKLPRHFKSPNQVIRAGGLPRGRVCVRRWANTGEDQAIPASETSQPSLA